MKMRPEYHYAEIVLDLNDWEEIINSKKIDELSNVLVINQEEYLGEAKPDTTEKVRNKSIQLLHTPDSKLDGIYQLLEYRYIESDAGEMSIFIKTKSDEIPPLGHNKNGKNYYSDFQQLSPLNNNSSCASSSCFMNLWGLFSVLGFIVIFTIISGLFNGASLNEIQQNLPGCDNCLDSVISIFDFDEQTQEDEEVEIDAINPTKEPFKYLKYLSIQESNKLDISLLWNTRNDLDLIAVDPDGELLWKNNKISAFGIMDKSSNDSQLDSFGKYSKILSIEASDSLAVEHLYFSEGTKLKKGVYRFYTLSSDKRENCLKKEVIYVRVVHNNKEKFMTKNIPNSVNNRCLGEENFKQIYTAQKLDFYRENNAAVLLFQLKVN